ncbi:MAG: glycosyltransferase family 1 protein [Patescibacteria group bacterium]|jgi:glycosyltransferase involved in cell wall biosynthesis
MKIGIDARFYGPIGKGLGRYTQEVVENIIKITNDSLPADSRLAIDYVIFLSPDNFDEFDGNRPNVKKVKLTCSWYSWSEQLFFPYYLWREHLDLIHFPHFNVPLLTPIRFVVTIHDLILTHFPTVRATTHHHFWYYFKNFAYRFVILMALKRARRIITVSEFTKNDIVKRFKINSSKIIVTYEGVANLSAGRDSLFVAKLDSREILAQYHIPQNFLLYVGNAYPHKNLEILLQVFSKLHVERPELRLVLVGKIDYFYERVQAVARVLNLWQSGNINSPVIFPGYVPDAQLEILYAEARVYVFPSLYEGFGLPPLEAMAQGCPVISSDRASLPEILSDAALYFNPEDKTDILSKIKIVLEDNVQRDSLKKRGPVQAKKYNWWECARLTLAVYREALKM